jgi:transposase-like protein
MTQQNMTTSRFNLHRFIDAQQPLYATALAELQGGRKRGRMETPRAISSTARRYGISRSLLLNWRRSFCTEPDGAEGQRSGFVRAMVVADPARSARAAPAATLANPGAVLKRSVGTNGPFEGDKSLSRRRHS